MGRSYAGILGPLAFLTEIVRGVSQSAGTESTVTTAVAALFAFALIGFVFGELAGWVVNDSVRSQLAAEIAAAKPKPAAAKPGVTSAATPVASNATVGKPIVAATTIKPNKPNVPAAAGSNNKN